jgi:hypothetical protein
MQQELKELKSKRKPEEADHAESPKAQRMCFNLEYEPTGQEVFLAMTGSGSALAEEADESKYSESQTLTAKRMNSRTRAMFIMMKR